MSQVIKQIEDILNLRLHEAPKRDGDPLAALMPFKENYPKYALDEDGNLIGLNLAKTGLNDDHWQQIMALPGLSTHLKALNLCENALTSCSLAHLTGLQELNLSENTALTSLSIPNAMPALRRLDASECQLSEFTLPIGCNSLTGLDLRKNVIKSAQIAICPVLEFIDLGHNELTQLVMPAGFAALKHLFLNNNQLESLEFAAPLPNLRSLQLRGNKLTVLPNNLLSFTQLNALYLHGNPLPSMRDVISNEEHGNSWEMVQSYLRSQQKSALKYLHQAKMVLVGNGEVGKTSIRRKLLDKKAKLPEKHERTPGLDIQPYIVTKLDNAITSLPELIDFQLNIWDFGGQGKYREIQQLFCGRKTLYLFVTSYDDLPKKEDYVGFEYWLSMVNAYSYEVVENCHSPVIHVVNKIDEQEQRINELDCTTIFPNLKRFVKISCETLKNFEQLETAIREVLPEVSTDMFTAQFSEFWLRVKEELEQRKAENHISMTEYLRICEANQLDLNESMGWIQILDRIGTVIYFGENPDLKDWVILNPNWAKDALYKVLDSPLTEEGIFKPKFFSTIWQGYSSEEQQNLIKLMLAYRLCYQQADARGNTEYVIPALLPTLAPIFPEYLQRPAYELKCVFEPFIPAGTVSKLMVMLHDGSKNTFRNAGPDAIIEKIDRSLLVEVNNGFMWKNNVVARDVIHNTYAHVREDWEAKSVYIDLFGKDVLPIFDYIRQNLESINQTLKSTKYLEQLHLKTQAKYNGKWQDLDNLTDLGIKFFSSKV